MTSNIWTTAAAVLVLTLWWSPGTALDKPATQAKPAQDKPIAQDKPAEAGTATPAAARPVRPEGGSAFSGMAGSWVGNGTISASNGSKERLRCRAHHNVGEGGRKVAINVRCASDSYKIDLTGTLVNRRGRVFGSWSESNYSASGTVSGTASGGHIRAVATSSSFTAGLSIVTSGSRQSITITPRETAITSVQVGLRKS